MMTSGYFFRGLQILGQISAYGCSVSSTSEKNVNTAARLERLAEDCEARRNSRKAIING